MYRSEPTIPICACPEPENCEPDCPEKAEAICDPGTKCISPGTPDKKPYEMCRQVINPRKKRDANTTSLDEYIQSVTRPQFSQQAENQPNVRFKLFIVPILHRGWGL